MSTGVSQGEEGSSLRAPHSSEMETSRSGLEQLDLCLNVFLISVGKCVGTLPLSLLTLHHKIISSHSEEQLRN